MSAVAVRDLRRGLVGDEHGNSVEPCQKSQKMVDMEINGVEEEVPSWMVNWVHLPG